MDEELAKAYWNAAFNAVHDMGPYLFEPGGEGRAIELARQAAAALDACEAQDARLRAKVEQLRERLRYHGDRRGA